jgi:hypothetical protein
VNVDALLVNESEVGSKRLPGTPAIPGNEQEPCKDAGSSNGSGANLLFLRTGTAAGDVQSSRCLQSLDFANGELFHVLSPFSSMGGRALGDSKRYSRLRLGYSRPFSACFASSVLNHVSESFQRTPPGEPKKDFYGYFASPGVHIFWL